MILVILAVQVLVSLCGLPRHFVRPSEVWFVLDLLQHLVHWFSEYSPDAPYAGRLWLPRKVSPRMTVCVPVRPEIPPLLRDNLLLSSALHLVLLYSLILVDLVHQLAHAGGDWEAALECVDGDAVEVSIHFVIHFPVPTRVSFQGLSVAYGQ